jgi:hypothetical protein
VPTMAPAEFLAEELSILNGNDGGHRPDVVAL